MRRSSRPAGGPRDLDGRPLIYLTFGSVLPQMDLFPALCRAAIDQLEGIPARVLVTIGTDRDPADLGFAACRSARRAVGSAARRDAARGGDGLPRRLRHHPHGTVGRSPHGGHPVLRRPALQRPPSRRPRRGNRPGGRPRGRGELGDAVRVVLDDPTYRAAAQRVADDVATLPSVDEAPAFLRELAPRLTAAAGRRPGPPAESSGW